jgi:hypothetical protein
MVKFSTAKHPSVKILQAAIPTRRLQKGKEQALGVWTTVPMPTIDRDRAPPLIAKTEPH